MSCDDINECAQSPSPCPRNSYCTNTVGSYHCTCNNGFTNVNNTTALTTPTCVDIDECELKIDHCLRTSETCVNLPGSYACQCKVGYFYMNKSCVLDFPRVGVDDLIESSSTTKVTIISTKKSNTPPQQQQQPSLIWLTTQPQSNSGLAKSNQSDQTGLYLLIILPIVVVLILALCASSICYCWYKM
jgi:hypothetical protein